MALDRTFESAKNHSRSGWNISLVGQKDAERMIKTCKDLLNSERVQDAILPAAQLVRDVAKRLVPVGKDEKRVKSRKSGKHLRDLIFATKGRRYNSGMIGAVSTQVANIFELDASSEGPSVIVGVDLLKAPHAHLIEFGHMQVVHGSSRGGGNRSKKKYGDAIGYVPARPFLRPAIAACRRMIVQVIESALVRLLAPYNSH